jgi:hypothetical protein
MSLRIFVEEWVSQVWSIVVIAVVWIVWRNGVALAIDSFLQWGGYVLHSRKMKSDAAATGDAAAEEKRAENPAAT